ncbi:MAG: hypothetical protein OHK0026_15690 [Rhodocyclaceae bacterium]
MGGLAACLGAGPQARAGGDAEARVLDALRRQAAERGEPSGQSFGQAAASPASAYRGKGRYRGKQDGEARGGPQFRADREERERVLNERVRRAAREDATERRSQ